jgi:Tetratricopeptide repeat
VHALHTPVTAHAIGELIDVEGSRSLRACRSTPSHSSSARWRSGRRHLVLSITLSEQSLNNLAWLDKRPNADAEPLLKRALAICEKALGPDHPEVTRSLDNPASLYFGQARFSDAELLFRRALRVTEKALGGPKHPEVAYACGPELNTAMADERAAADCTPGTAGSVGHGHAAVHRHKVAARLGVALDRSRGAAHLRVATDKCMVVRHMAVADRSWEAGHSRGVPRKRMAAPHNRRAEGRSWEADHSLKAGHNRMGAAQSQAVAEPAPGLRHDWELRSRRAALPKRQPQYSSSA